MKTPQEIVIHDDDGEVIRFSLLIEDSVKSIPIGIWTRKHGWNTVISQLHEIDGGHERNLLNIILNSPKGLTISNPEGKRELDEA